jgi:glycosyltransferase involved in cell wall biosynthesis
MIKLIRLTTVPTSLDKLLTGQFKYMGENGFDVHLISSGSETLPDIAQRELSEYTVVDMARTISPLKDFVSLIKLINNLRKLKPTIVHTHTPKAGLLGMLASWITRVPIRLHTVAGLPLMETTGVKRKILGWAEWVTYKCAVKVYPNSKKLKDFIIENNFCPTDKLKVIGNGSSNGINTNHFKLDALISKQADELKNDFELTESNFIFLFIGRLVKDKGIEELVEAFLNINDRYPFTRLMLVGPFEHERDPLSNKCRKSIENNKSMLMAGYQKDVRPYLALSNVLVFPSYREGFPNVPMQAGCFELPCIVTNINGCNEIIEHELNGLIIPTKNANALETAMKRVMEDKLLYATLKSNARKIIVQRYEQTYFWSLLLKEYKEHLAKYEIV